MDRRRKLSVSQYKEIKGRFISGESQNSLAVRFGVSRTYIGYILFPDRDKQRRVPLSSLEWDTCWMSVMYALHDKRCLFLLRDLLRSYFYRWTPSQKEVLVKELKGWLFEMTGNFSLDFDGGPDDECFWVNGTSVYYWVLFVSTLDQTSHERVFLKQSGVEVECFELGDRFYPISPVSWWDYDELKYFCLDQVVRV